MVNERITYIHGDLTWILVQTIVKTLETWLWLTAGVPVSHSQAWLREKRNFWCVWNNNSYCLFILMDPPKADYITDILLLQVCCSLMFKCDTFVNLKDRFFFSFCKSNNSKSVVSCAFFSVHHACSVVWHNQVSTLVPRLFFVWIKVNMKREQPLCLDALAH